MKIPADDPNEGCFFASFFFQQENHDKKNQFIELETDVMVALTEKMLPKKIISSIRLSSNKPTLKKVCIKYTPED